MMTTFTLNADGTLTVSVTIELQGSLINMENSILDALNNAGNSATLS
jgi:hypothetical protein